MEVVQGKQQRWILLAKRGELKHFNQLGVPQRPEEEC